MTGNPHDNPKGNDAMPDYPTRFGQYLGTLMAVLGVVGVLDMSATQASVPVLAVGPPVTPDQVQQWGPVVGSIVMVIGGSFMTLYFKFTTSREERIKDSVQSQLDEILNRIEVIEKRVDTRKASVESSLEGIHDEITSIMTKLERHDDVIMRAQKRAAERAADTQFGDRK